jgi:hypothetical protein
MCLLAAAQPELAQMQREQTPLHMSVFKTGILGTGNTLMDMMHMLDQLVAQACPAHLGWF